MHIKVLFTLTTYSIKRKQRTFPASVKNNTGWMRVWIRSSALRTVCILCTWGHDFVSDTFLAVSPFLTWSPSIIPLTQIPVLFLPKTAFSSITIDYLPLFFIIHSILLLFDTNLFHFCGSKWKDPNKFLTILNADKLIKLMVLNLH
jgi:hypothetical protein